MKTNQNSYSVDVSDSRIREILDASDQSFEELDYIPSADRLTFSNGFYVKCTALFIDIRGSSKLPESHTRPVLAKIYRAYLSECVAILNQDENCREVFITGDCVSGIFDTTTKDAINQTFYRAGQLNTLLTLLNWRLEQKGYSTIQCGIGIDYGQALMLKAGYKGSGINEIIWMGDVVNKASKLCHKGNRDSHKAIQLSRVIYSNLSEKCRALVEPCCDSLADLFEPQSYEGDLVAVAMNEEIDLKKQPRPLGLAALAGAYQPAQGGLGLLSSQRTKGLFDF